MRDDRRSTKGGKRTAVLIATYEMGRQPFGLASPAAWLRDAGVDVRLIDLSRQAFDQDAFDDVDVIAFHLPMHAATRLAVPVVRRVRAIAPGARLCAYGLYAPLNAGLLQSLGVDHVLGGEFEADLTALATGLTPPLARAGSRLPRLDLRRPDRRGLPALSSYASLQLGGARRVVGYTEASRGCKHVCRHCPVVPVYGGQFRVVPVAVVISDIEAQVAGGAQHITFGDPDFFNGIRHARAVIDGLARECPGVTYDVTIKVEHLLRHADTLPRLVDTGCLFVTSAVEAFDDTILARLDKGHTRADVETVVGLCRAAGVTLVPTFVAFTPWTTTDGYVDFLDEIARLDLVAAIAPIQLALRLLVTEGSGLLEDDVVGDLTGRFDVERLVYPWTHPDPAVDHLCDEVGALVGRRLSADRYQVFEEIRALAGKRTGRVLASRATAPRSRAAVPYLNEPWYC